MQNANQDSDDNITPYRINGNNLNTFIGIPSIDVNDPMNVNIQSVNTNSSLNGNNLNNQVNVLNNSIDNNIDNSINNKQELSSRTPIDNTNNSDTSVKRNFVSNNKTKKKMVSINLGPEFKVALLIIVILLVFIFLLPIITS